MKTKKSTTLNEISELCDSILDGRDYKEKEELTGMLLEYVVSDLGIKGLLDSLDSLDATYQNIAWVELDDITQKQKMKEFVRNGLGYSTSQIERKSNVNLL